MIYVTGTLVRGMELIRGSAQALAHLKAITRYLPVTTGFFSLKFAATCSHVMSILSLYKDGDFGFLLPSMKPRCLKVTMSPTFSFHLFTNSVVPGPATKVTPFGLRESENEMDERNSFYQAFERACSHFTFPKVASKRFNDPGLGISKFLFDMDGGELLDRKIQTNTDNDLVFQKPSRSSCFIGSHWISEDDSFSCPVDDILKKFLQMLCTFAYFCWRHLNVRM